LEANRRPELRAAYARGGRQLRERGAAMLAAAGSTDPHRHARSVAAWSDGMIFEAVAGADGRVPDQAELRAGARELLLGVLGR
ncbi:MAG: TetR/AcrR family transcriptional regulator, partial [Actinomycetia bacterium]|nr:TetR/AcrR family transcriptional regulator [Actinomycetes bacterium]